MTTIACNRTEIACDLQYTNPDGTKWKGAPKVFYIPPSILYPKPYYVGMAGTAGAMLQFADYLTSPETIPKPEMDKEDSVYCIILTSDKKLFMFDQLLKWLEIKDDFIATGSGHSIAMGAMLSGATPTEAVRAASKYDVYTGMGVKTFNFA